MFDNEFDELFRNRLKGHPSAVPDDMWLRIRGRADARGGFNPRRWYFIGLVMLVAGLVGGSRFWRSSHFVPGRQQPPNAVAARQNSIAPNGVAARRNLSSSPAAFAQGDPVVSKSLSPIPQTHSVSEPASLRSGSVPRSQSGPGFLATDAGTGAANPSAAAANPSAAANPRTVAANRTSYSWFPSLAHTSRAFASPFANWPKGNPIPSPVPTHPKEYSGWFVEPYFSPDFLFTSRRQGSSYSAGARLGKTLGQGFSASIGLQFSHVSLRPPDSSFLLTNQFNNIDLPVLLGYRLGSARFNTTIHAGLIWNLHSQSVGVAEPGIYNSSLGLSFYFGLEFLETYDSHWSIFAEPHIRYQLFNRKYDLLQSPDLGGLSLGVRYSFTRRPKPIFFRPISRNH